MSTFHVPRSKASIKQNRFQFTMPDDPKRVYDIPLLKYLPPKLAVEASELSEIAFTKLLFETYMPDAFDQFEDSEQLQAFMAAWSEASNVTPGESSASPA